MNHSSASDPMQFETRAIHVGQDPDTATGAVIVPIYQTSTYAQSAVGEHQGYDYSRTDNPTRTALQECLASLEGGRFGLVFASGMASITTLLLTLKQGDHVVVADDVYGGTYRLFQRVFTDFGLEFTFVDMTDRIATRAAFKPNTRLLWMETPTNPLLKVVDIADISALAHERDILVGVDNTFATPYLQRPLEFGADLVMHSTTKYLGGHSDVIHGCLMMNDSDLREKLYFLQKSCGAVPGPQDCFLILRGIKTLHVRMQRHCENGEKIAQFLRNHSKVAKVYWCGFEDHPGYAVAKKQMRGFGGMMSFELKDQSATELKRVVSSTKLFSLAESLGGIESMINHPATMTHASIPREERIKNGLSDALIRLSVGIEDADDLINDLKQVLG